MTDTLTTDKILREVDENWDTNFTHSQYLKIRQAMAKYAFAATMDTMVLQEANNILNNYEEFLKEELKVV